MVEETLLCPPMNQGVVEEISISAGRFSGGWGNASVSVGESGDGVCEGTGCAATPGYWSADARAGASEEVIVFSNGGDSTSGNTGPARRRSELSKAPRRRSSPLAASSSFIGSSTRGSRRAASTTSLVHGSTAVSATSVGGDWVGGDNRVGVGVSSSDCSALGSSSPGSQTGMIGSSALWVLKPALG
jgi:hypothetical protein